MLLKFDILFKIIFQDDDVKKIDFETFSACLETYFEEAENKDKETERKILGAAFDRFDVDKSGYFDKAELKNMLVKCGEKVTDKEIDKLFELADESKDGKLHKNGKCIPVKGTEMFRESVSKHAWEYGFAPFRIFFSSIFLFLIRLYVLVIFNINCNESR